MPSMKNRISAEGGGKSNREYVGSFMQWHRDDSLQNSKAQEKKMDANRWSHLSLLKLLCTAVCLWANLARYSPWIPDY